MDIYLVGGAVRDALLGRPVAERDWVVVGATPQELEARGFTPVGRDFPVFLHPQSREEYALARLERKTGPGYRGFVTEFAPDVTLEQDLARRDLTVNAMAQAADGRLIDPHGGRADLEQRVLRHVSPAFVEDPVRILRIARFLARFAHLGFRVAPETLELMRQMSASGELDALVPERVWRELERLLGEATPRAGIELLRECGALRIVLPEIDALFGVPQRPEWHPEVDTGEHVLLALQVAAARAAPVSVRFAVLMHDLGKALTPREQWPRHIDHEARGIPAIETLCRRLRVPQEHRDLAVLASRFHTHVHRGLELRAT
ncbi:MAG: multifunctional CCA addition/repair protein, partial [Gammaproteobacteria bacterium]|nr:multifunctional CCA addition/repair protein [Gammaproteobacteria bacterium]